MTVARRMSDRFHRGFYKFLLPGLARNLANSLSGFAVWLLNPISGNQALSWHRCYRNTRSKLRVSMPRMRLRYGKHTGERYRQPSYNAAGKRNTKVIKYKDIESNWALFQFLHGSIRIFIVVKSFSGRTFSATPLRASRVCVLLYPGGESRYLCKKRGKILKMWYQRPPLRRL